MSEKIAYTIQVVLLGAVLAVSLALALGDRPSGQDTTFVVP